jgi:hypothetical protein
MKVEVATDFAEIVPRQTLIETLVVWIYRFNLDDWIFEIFDMIVGNFLAVLVPFCEIFEEDN